MKLKYSFTLLTLTTALYFVPAVAQKKPVTKAATKPAAPAKKTDAQNLGDAASKTSVKDTVGKGGNGANGQNGSSLSEEIVVTTAYKPVLADAVKIRRNPDLEDKAPYKAPLSYAPVDKRLERNSEIRQLDAMKMPPERDSVPLNNWVRAGIGNLKTTFAEGYFGNGRDEALQVGGYFRHLAQQGTIFKQNAMKNEIGVNGKSIMDDFTLTGRIDFSNRSNYFYGYNQLNPPTVALDVAKQHFNTLGAEGEIAKKYRDVENDFTYAAKIKGYTFANGFSGKESNIVLSGFLNQTIKQFYAGLGASLDLSSQKDAAYAISNNIARANPYIKFQGANYKIDAGVNIAAEFGFSSRVFIFPAAKAEFQVIPKYVRVFVEAKGDVNKTSLKELSEVNPFLGENVAIQNSVDKLDIAAGLKGTLAPGLGFKATIYRNSVKNMPLFVSNFDFTKGYNRFNVIYDNGNARVSGFTGELDYKTSDDVNLFGRVEFIDYQLATEPQAWNLPKFKLSAGTAIHINDKVTINGSLLVRGDTKDPYLTNGQVTTISTFTDLNGGVQYKVNKRIAVFGQVNNILNTANQTWLYYSNYGFNIFGGASYSF